ncbi:unnamed protein product [Chrysoparadoxa australica]
MNAEDLQACNASLKCLLAREKCNPILVRLAWHDSGTYDDTVGSAQFPKCGGANGSIRFTPELGHGANAGLINAIKLLEPIKEKHPNVGWADLIQMASATAIEMAGGPKIPMRYGRVDTSVAEDCPAEGNLPGAAGPFDDGSATPAEHLRKVFHRMGLNDQEIVALSGAHTLGRAWPDRSGTCPKGKTGYTSGGHCPMTGSKSGGGLGKEGGMSWTCNWLKFDNSYFVELQHTEKDEDLLVLDTDKCLVEDEGFSQHAKLYAEDQDAFFAAYASAHAKLSELGSKFEPAEGIKL